MNISQSPRRRQIRHLPFTLVIAVFTALAPAGQPFDFVTQQVLPPSGYRDDWFGYSLAVGNGRLAIGAIYNGLDGEDAGAVYVFDAGDGSLLYRVSAPDISAGDNFGYDVAIDGELLVASAIGDSVGTTSNAGSMYMFDLSTGVYITRFTATDASVSDTLGWSVAISTPAAVAGAVNDRVGGVATGSVYAFDTRFLNQIRKFTPADGTPNAFYGAAVALTHSYLAVGAPRMNNGIGESGAVYIYSYFDGHLIHKLVPADARPDQSFGDGLAILGDRIYVGSPLDDDRGGNAGAVYVFDALSGAQLDKLVPPTLGSDKWFGASIAVDGSKLFVGVPFDDERAFNAGAVYVYDAETYEFVSKITIPDGLADDQFGFEVAAGDSQFAAGAHRRDAQGVDSGAAYTIREICHPDLNHDSLVDFFDISTLINVHIDYNGDGMFNFFDVSAFLSDFQAGCP